MPAGDRREAVWVCRACLLAIIAALRAPWSDELAVFCEVRYLITLLAGTRSQTLTQSISNLLVDFSLEP